MDHLDLDQLNEAFDDTQGTYTAVDLMPKAKTPQMFLLKGEGIDNFVVRLMAQKGDGDTLRNLTPSDKNIVVFLMTLNDKGNLAELRGGLGGNPMKTLVSVFDVVYNSIKPSVVQSIMFRFPAKKMKGQERAVNRIFSRLLAVRGKGRFVSLPEMANYSSKYSYVVAHKKNMDISDLPGAKNISDRFTKVETSIGDTYIDTKSGNQVTKGEVVADAIFTATNKVDNKAVIAKSRISRRDAINAQYTTELKYEPGSVAATKYAEITASTPDAIVTSETPTAPIGSIAEYTLSRAFKKKSIEYIDEAMSINVHMDPDKTELPTIQKQIMSRIYRKSPGTHEDKVAHGAQVIMQLNKILSEVTLDNLQSTLENCVALLSSVEFNDASEKEQTIRSFIREFTGEVIETLLPSFLSAGTSGLTESEEESLRWYCGEGFARINHYLLGLLKPSQNTNDVLKSISAIDDLFETKGAKLNKGIKLYRGQKVATDVFKYSIENKIYYFKNFVSTSIAPIIFFGGYANSTGEVVSATVDSESPVASELEIRRSEVSVGFVISGADKIKVVVPGATSPYPNECEVLLPRGTALRFDRVKFNGGYTASALIFATIVDPSQIDESEKIYDGDALLEEAKLVEMDRFSMLSVSKHVDTAIETLNRDAMDDMMADLLDINAVPPKFK